MDAHPAIRDLLDQLAVEMEHLDPALYPKGGETTKLDLLKMRLHRMLGEEGHDAQVYKWIEEALDALEDRDRRQSILDELNRRLREGDQSP